MKTRLTAWFGLFFACLYATPALAQVGGSRLSQMPTDLQREGEAWTGSKLWYTILALSIIVAAILYMFRTAQLVGKVVQVVIAGCFIAGVTFWLSYSGFAP